MALSPRTPRSKSPSNRRVKRPPTTCDANGRSHGSCSTQTERLTTIPRQFGLNCFPHADAFQLAVSPPFQALAGLLPIPLLTLIFACEPLRQAGNELGPVWPSDEDGLK